jgi:hypothetical protein
MDFRQWESELQLMGRDHDDFVARFKRRVARVEYEGHSILEDLKAYDRKIVIPIGLRRSRIASRPSGASRSAEALAKVNKNISVRIVPSAFLLSNVISHLAQAITMISACHAKITRDKIVHN